MPCKLPLICLGEVCDRLPDCDSQTPCPPGNICVDGGCLPSDAMLTKNIGPGGGIVRGPDGVQLIVLENSVVDVVQFAIGRASGAALNGFTALSEAYQIAPANLVLDRTASVRIPAAEIGLDVHVYFATSAQGPWSALIGEVAGTQAVGETRVMGYFAAGKP